MLHDWTQFLWVGLATGYSFVGWVLWVGYGFNIILSMGFGLGSG